MTDSPIAFAQSTRAAVIDSYWLERATLEKMRRKSKFSVGGNGRDQPDEILFGRGFQIASRRTSATVRVRMVATHDFAIAPAQTSQQSKMLGRIDLEAIIVVGKVFRRMKRMSLDRIAMPHTFDQAATFAGEGGKRLGEELLSEFIRQEEHLIRD